MNCKEAQSYIEEAIDGSLEGSRKRKVDAHLSRCAGCRERFAAEKAEHAAFFRALKEVSDIPPAPVSDADFAARLVEAVPAATAKSGGVMVPVWLRRAAVFALICGGAALAAWRIENGELRIENDGGDSGIENGELRIENYGDDLVGRGVLDAPESPGRAASPLAAAESPPSSTTLETQGENQMNMNKVKKALLGAAAISAAQLGAGSGEYQFIISGYPAADNCHSDVSSGTSLEFGVLSDVSASDALDARSRTDDLSNHSPLRSDKFCGMNITIR